MQELVLNQDIQQIVNHGHFLPLISVKLNYSTELYIHKIGGIVHHVQSRYRPTGSKSNFSSCP